MNSSSAFLFALLFLNMINAMDRLKQKKSSQKMSILIEETDSHEEDMCHSKKYKHLIIQKPNNQQSLLQKQALTECVKKIKKHAITEITNSYLIDFYWKLYAMSYYIEKNDILEAHSTLKRITALREKIKESHYILSNILDLLIWDEQLSMEDQNFIEQVDQKKLNILNQYCINTTSTLNEIAKKNIENVCIKELKREVMIRREKIILIGAEITTCEPQKWLKEAHKKESFSFFIPIKQSTNSRCILN